jgi:formylglycine-generating enzyme required for sulfatase activity
MSDVFISYKKQDFAIAERVVGALRAQRLSVWWDDSLTARSAWDAELERAIASAAAVVVLWSPRSVDSDWVRTEAHYAQDHGKLIPVMMEPCTIPLAFMLRQTVDLCDWGGEIDHRQWRKLLAWISDLTSATTGTTGIPTGPGVAPRNAFRDAVGQLASGEPVVDGAFVTASTPAGTAFRDGDAIPVMRIVPPGAFLLGSAATEPDRLVVEGPQKRIEIPVPFAIGVFPVLVSEYEAARGARPTAEAPASRSNRWTGLFRQRPTADQASTSQNRSLPVTHVSFQDANAFVTAISKTTGELYRLPSEAEWEYACRAGSRGRYSFGDLVDATRAAFGLKAGPVVPGSFPANPFGLYDMHGNVREWTTDLWHESYESTPPDGSPATEGHGSMRVVRGGGWSDSAPVLRSAARMRATESIRANVIGFRVVRTLG